MVQSFVCECISNWRDVLFDSSEMSVEKGVRGKEGGTVGGKEGGSGRGESHRGVH